jgi:hypothetical protein
MVLFAPAFTGSVHAVALLHIAEFCCELASLQTGLPHVLHAGPARNQESGAPLPASHPVGPYPSSCTEWDVV